MAKLKIPNLTPKQVKHFRSHICIPDNKYQDKMCWLWSGCTDDWGYGLFSINRKNYRTHRIMYYLNYGVDPGELLVCHTCDIPNCVNPKHLWLGTDAQNNADMIAKKRSKHPSQIGELNGTSKLTGKLVKKIREQYKQGATTIRQLATQYSVSHNAIWLAIKHKTWT